MCAMLRKLGFAAVVALVLASGGLSSVRAGKVYWTIGGQEKIQRANADGSNVQDVITELTFPRGIAVDLEGGKIYWTLDHFGAIVCNPALPLDKKIQRADLDGSNVEDVVLGLLDPSGIALDLGNGKIYWTEKVCDDPGNSTNSTW